jgi:hypothetical protein
VEKTKISLGDTSSMACERRGDERRHCLSKGSTSFWRLKGLVIVSKTDTSHDFVVVFEVEPLINRSFYFDTAIYKGFSDHFVCDVLSAIPGCQYSVCHG